MAQGRRARRRAGQSVGGMTTEFIGDWAGVINFFGKAGIEVKKKVEEAQWQICKKLRDIVRGHLLAQDLGWTPLASKTMARKKKNKTTMLIDTELYINSIKVWKEKGVAKVGIKKGIMYRRAKQTVPLERVAIWMEVGTGRVPARPLWKPSIDELGGTAGVKEFVVDAIFRRLKWLGNPHKALKITRGKVNKVK